MMLVGAVICTAGSSSYAQTVWQFKRKICKRIKK